MGVGCDVGLRVVVTGVGENVADEDGKGSAEAKVAKTTTRRASMVVDERMPRC